MDFDPLVLRSSRLLHSLSLPGVGRLLRFHDQQLRQRGGQVIERLTVRKRDRQALSALVVFLNTLGKPLFQAGNGVRCGGLGDFLLRDQFAEEAEHRAEQFAARRRHAVALGLTPPGWTGGFLHRAGEGIVLLDLAVNLFAMVEIVGQCGVHVRQ